MSKYSKQKEEVSAEFNKITKSEYDQLRKGMSQYTQQRINGRLQSRWMQYMLELNVVRLDEHGDAIVKDPFQYTKWNQALDNMDRRDEDELKEHWKQNPEERVEWETHMTGFFKEIREGAKTLTRNMKLTNQEK